MKSDGKTTEFKIYHLIKKYIKILLYCEIQYLQYFKTPQDIIERLPKHTHNPKVLGSSPSPATIKKEPSSFELDPL
jgi:hypothetical protein